MPRRLLRRLKLSRGRTRSLPLLPATIRPRSGLADALGKTEVPTALNLGGLKARIARDLVRSDLSAEIEDIIPECIREVAAYSFWFNDVRELTFNTVAGQAFYGAAALSYLPWLSKIDALWIVVNGQRRNLREVMPAEIDRQMDGSPSDGEPDCFARQADGLRFYPVPDRVFPVFIDGVSRLSPLVLDSDANAWMTEGEAMIRALAKAKLMESPVDNPERAARFRAIYINERAELLKQTETRHGTGSMALFGV